MTNTALDYEIAANRFKPEALDELAYAVKAMQTEGYSPRDIAEAMRLSPADVLNLLAGKQP